jgi:hypothetical protein
MVQISVCGSDRLTINDEQLTISENAARFDYIK